MGHVGGGSGGRAGSNHACQILFLMGLLGSVSAKLLVQI